MTGEIAGIHEKDADCSSCEELSARGATSVDSPRAEIAQHCDASMRDGGGHFESQQSGTAAFAGEHLSAFHPPATSRNAINNVTSRFTWMSGYGSESRMATAQIIRVHYCDAEKIYPAAQAVTDAPAASARQEKSLAATGKERRVYSRLV